MVSTSQDLRPDFAFWTGFYTGDDPFQWASKKAYLDMNRTLTFRETAEKGDKKAQSSIEKQRKAWQAEGTKIIQCAFLEMSGDFNTWHAKTCEALINLYGEDKLVIRNQKTRPEEPAKLTWGQAQKWLNMTLKYLWLLKRLGLLNEENTKIINTYERKFHVPLDSYILRYAARQNQSKENPFPKGNGLSGDFSAEWKKFKSEWSKIEDREDYYAYQKKIAGAIEDGKSPLEWELVHWHKALSYYDAPKQTEKTK